MPSTPTFALFGTYMLCYIIGSINFSLLAARLSQGKDLREQGSKNAGFTNLLRTGNKKIAVLVLLLDISRAYLVVLGCRFIPIEIHWPFMAIPMLLGNLWPVFHQFKGGKGIAMSLGIIFAIHPLAGLVGVVSMLAVIAITKKVSVGSLCFLLAATITLFLIASIPEATTALIILVFGIYSHRENIKRLTSGTEPSIF